MTAGRPGVALLDWDNSLHPGFTLGPWLGRLARDDAERAAAARFGTAVDAYDAGRLPYDDLARLAEDLYTGMVDGRPTTDVAALAADLAATVALRPGAAELVAAVRALGWRPIVVSGAPEEVLLAHAEHLSIRREDVHGWSLARRGDRYLGRLASGNTARGVHKAAFAERIAADHAIELGLGDSDADLPLIDAARIGVRIDPRSRDEARRASWADRATGRSGTGSLADLARALARMVG